MHCPGATVAVTVTVAGVWRTSLPEGLAGVDSGSAKATVTVVDKAIAAKAGAISALLNVIMVATLGLIRALQPPAARSNYPHAA
ncbi:hypothetical protein MAUB_57770 [Mycolicibacterium aubagnense]|uniref:Uncharacterized protein n=1 Tax=Mycolicibacterium aubagnense TaxID=319707 RepID=A0ABM7IMC6_9MYCO|nr:hypothetical protein MAUB_57770 [Mycolicibacterium aubagnense]